MSKSADELPVAADMGVSGSGVEWAVLSGKAYRNLMDEVDGYRLRIAQLEDTLRSYSIAMSALRGQWEQVFGNILR